MREEEQSNSNILFQHVNNNITNTRKKIFLFLEPAYNENKMRNAYRATDVERTFPPWFKAIRSLWSEIESSSPRDILA